MPYVFEYQCQQATVLFQVSAYLKTDKVSVTLMMRRFLCFEPWTIHWSTKLYVQGMGLQSSNWSSQNKNAAIPQKFPGRNPGPFNHERFAIGEHRYRSSCRRHPTTDIDIDYSDIRKKYGDWKFSYQNLKSPDVDAKVHSDIQYFKKRLAGINPTPLGFEGEPLPLSYNAFL
jgi:hypothetical protein